MSLPLSSGLVLRGHFPHLPLVASVCVCVCVGGGSQVTTTNKEESNLLLPYNGKLSREKTFTNSHKTLKFEVLSLESFPLYSIIVTDDVAGKESHSRAKNLSRLTPEIFRHN